MRDQAEEYEIDGAEGSNYETHGDMNTNQVEGTAYSISFLNLFFFQFFIFIESK